MGVEDMPTDTFVQNFVISKISRSKFDELSSSGMLNENELYLVEDPQIDAGNQPIVNVSTPSSSTDAANKGYVDGASSALATDISTLSTAMSGKADSTYVNQMFSSLSGVATTTSNGLMSFSDKEKLDSIASGATANEGTITAITASSPLSGGGSSGAVTITHESTSVVAGSYGDTSAQTPSFGQSFKVLSATVNQTGHVTAMSEHTVKIPDAVIPSYDTVTSSTAGLMSPADKIKLDGTNVNDASLTINVNGSSLAAFSANASSNTVCDIYTSYLISSLSPQGDSEYPSYELFDQTVNHITLGSEVASAEIMFPPSVLGRSRDFFVRLVIESDETPTISFIEQSSASVSFDTDDDAWAEIEPGVNLLLFTDTAQ